jgi:hypothetical protein
MENVPSPRPKYILVFAIIAILFGTVTLFSGGSVLFVDGTGRADAGNYVPFVLWFNFLAGFAYIIAGIGLYLWRKWAVELAMLIALATVLVSAALGVYIFTGGAYEMRTVGAMALRSVLWLVIAFGARAAWKSRRA